MTALNGKLEQADADNYQQQTAFEEAEAARTTLKASLEHLENERNALCEERDQARSELESQQQSLTAQQAQWQQQLDEKDTNIATRFEELAKLTQMLEQAGADKQQQQAAFEEAEAARTTLQASLERLENERNALREERDQARSELEAQQQSLTTQQAQWQQQLDEKDANIATRFEELAKLTEMLEERDQQLEGLKLRYEPEMVSQSNGEPGAQGPRINKRKQKRDAAELAASELLDRQWYLQAYPDISADARYARNPALHYLKFGGFESRNPSEHFDSQWYLNDNPDVAISGLNPLALWPSGRAPPHCRGDNRPINRAPTKTSGVGWLGARFSERWIANDRPINRAPKYLCKSYPMLATIA